MQIQRMVEAGSEVVVIPMGGTLVRNLPDSVQVRRGITRVYTFALNGVGDMVATVDHDEDIKRLLSIRDGYRPYGEESETEAKARFRWRDLDRLPTVKQAAVDADGQPPVVDVFEDDEDDITDIGTGEPVDTEDKQPLLAGDLPEPPVANADGSLWMEWGAKVIGDVKDKKAIAAYGADNYGLEFVPQLGALKMLKAIAQAQSATA